MKKGIRKICANCKHSEKNDWNSNLVICNKLPEMITLVHPDSGVDIIDCVNWSDEPCYEVNKYFSCNNFELK